MDRQDFFNGLELQNQYVVNQEVQTERLLKNVAFVFDRHLKFLPDWNRSQIAFSLKAFAVDAFD
jgi:hypothetical protein